MRKKLFRNILSSMAIMLSISLVLIIFILNNYFVGQEQDRLSTEANLAATAIETSGQKYLNELEEDQLRLTWIDNTGNVLYDSEAQQSEMENHSSREEFKQALVDGTGYAIRRSDTMAHETIYYAQKLKDGSVIRVAEDYEAVWALTFRLATPIIWIFLIAALISAILANYLAKRLSQPINDIDLDHPNDCKGYDEIRPLLNRIDSQNRQIQEQMDELHQKKKEFETVTNNISEALILLNNDGEILSINDAAISLFHFKDTEISTILKNEDIHDMISPLLEGEEKDVVTQVNGFTIRIVGRPIYSHEVLTGASILAYDITDAYEAEQQRKEFTANVSHELKTPLQSIMGSAELLQNHLVKKADMDSFYEKIRKESARMLTLIDDIIRLSQLDEETPVEEAVIDLKDLALEANESLSSAAKAKNITIVNKLNSAKVRANSRLIYEVFYNLIDNAIRYSNSNHTVIVRTWTERDDAILTVQDEGIGIPPESQGRIFERFYRVDKSHSRATGGTGLGLSIVKHAVSKSHGIIHLMSEPGKGSTFMVKFPIAE